MQRVILPESTTCIFTESLPNATILCGAMYHLIQNPQKKCFLCEMFIKKFGVDKKVDKRVGKLESLDTSIDSDDSSDL